jgi:hypothetical protein
MKILFTLILVVSSAMVSGQIADRTEMNCDGESRSIYETGDAGLPLIVASKGFDCSICQNQADDVRDFANANEGEVAIWAAMTNTYSSAVPTCGQLAGWSSTYNWGQSIFAFIDEEEFWLQTGTPRYYVIHPVTHEIVYEGSSFSTASATALSLVTTTVGDDPKVNPLKIYQSGSEIIVETSEILHGGLRIYSLSGQEVYATYITQDNGRLSLTVPFKTGIYIAELNSNGNRSIGKLIFTQY